MPDISPSNMYFLRFWAKIQRCFHWAGGGTGAFRTGLDWADVKTISEIEKVKLSKPILARLRKAESLCVASDINNLKKSER